MTDLPKCRMCGSEPERCETAQHFYKCSSAACNLYRVALYKNQWRTLMGHSGDAGEMVPFGHLILSGIEGGEYCDCDIAWSHKIAEKLQERYVSNDKAVYLQIYAKPPETGE